MKLNISTLPPNGRPLDLETSLATLQERMQADSGINFTTPPKIQGRISPQPSGAFLACTVTASYNQPCSRCIEPKTRTAECTIEVALKPREQQDLCDDDVGLIHYEHDTIDIADIAEEFLILSLDIYWSPTLDSKGECSLCGESPNACGEPTETKGNHLGEKLRAALASKKNTE